MAYRLAATLSGVVERTQTGCAKLEATVNIAAHTLAFHRATPCRVPTSRARLEALVIEEGFGNLDENIF